MSDLVFEIPGKPIAKKRPRFCRRGKFVTTYNDQETEEGKMMNLIVQQLPDDFKVLDGPLRLKSYFGMPIPKSTSKKKRAQMIANEIMHVKKPDVDNLLKMIKDCMNEIVYRDDSQIVSVEAWKTYSENPETVVVVSEA